MVSDCFNIVDQSLSHMFFSFSLAQSYLKPMRLHQPCWLGGKDRLFSLKRPYASLGGVFLIDHLTGGVPPVSVA